MLNVNIDDSPYTVTHATSPVHAVCNMQLLLIYSWRVHAWELNTHTKSAASALLHVISNFLGLDASLASSFTFGLLNEILSLVKGRTVGSKDKIRAYLKIEEQT